MAIDYFEVECREESGRRAYIDIASNVLQDLDLIKIVRKIHILIDLDFPFFLAVGETRKLPPPVKIRDFANVMESEGKVVLDIGEETYLSQMLTILWDKFGRDVVIQPDRFTVTISSEFTNTKEIEELTVYDPSISMYKDLIYALQWIAPEGFRVRREWIDKGKFFYVASENTLQKEIIDPIIEEKIKLLKEAS
ncbi:methanogenesis marker 17 protein [Methanomicrobium antiquum]|uniref:Methanogenesis marker 17 protein n=1 Tax=Methanomicrobium antiquum TaxID=487686 RepID=A0AAF0JLX1_9EURY|nr:methanogenesis marker 17 protein [Methanomicrobium antiquum]MDD3977549.1 methanogenesis marker 17 protein [Methanomicrobium sp.]WFN35861.1 methanogenesis marker 17 protein [Methanomicrobium antiquum]